MENENEPKEGSMEMSNLEAFLEATTPHLRWRSAPMDCFEAPSSVWQLDKKHVVDYFTLEDLWQHYSESSAYGIAVPLRFDQSAAAAGDNTITQHFVPYLSAIQIYTSAKTPIPTRSIGGSETDSWSDDSIADKLSRSWDAASDDSSHEEFDFRNPPKQTGYLNFQYTEWDPPYERPPIADKVAELAQDYPCLMSLKSAELSPWSWLSVAWYIASPHKILQCGRCADSDGSDSERTVAVSPFGLATYRMEGKLWRDEEPSSSSCPAAVGVGAGSSSNNDNNKRRRRLCDELYWAASSWLKQVGVHHPDLNYFTSHGHGSAAITSRR
ncbi:hypothetical protein PR202_ga03378 [Eleusine coracana subsp. coracana]|uniref:Uncharacterized protein n=1 Tax=Eleusine coracana subsp. coracana TaxID=191504 RepID=A0AAV5BND6_ELECO|nr:hypothetical protein PR202_ga03378 [Eleusine coracana subsp. coracana]